MRFNLTPASHRVLERASRLRLQRGVAAISFAKVLWALFEEEECRAAHWLREAELSLEQFLTSFGIQTLQSPVSAPPFPQGAYGISPGQYIPPAPPPPDLEATRTDNSAASIGNSSSGSSSPDGSERENRNEQEEQDEQPQDTWEPSEPPKYSLYSQRKQGQRSSGQSRLQLYLDDQRMSAWLLTPELEETLEMVAHRFIRQDNRQSISVSGGVKQIALGTPTFTLLTEHLLLTVALDTGDVGRWLRENGLEPTELYQRIDAETADGRRQTVEESESPHPNPLLEEEETVSAASPTGGLTPTVPDCRLPSAVCRLLDAAANRGREAIRVLEDYVRFILDDAGLTQRLKTFRHQFQGILQQFPMASRLAARNTEYDVGTEISADGEYLRPTVDDLLSANFSRLQESLRSLEEFSKMFDPQIARQFEQLRYQGYTLHKDVAFQQTPSLPLGDGRDDGDRTNEGICHPHPNPLPVGEGTIKNARLYALVDARSDESAFEQFITAIIAGGVDVIQLRDKQMDDRTLLSRSRKLKECIATSGRKVLFIMNDCPDLAVLAGADGVHVGQEELPATLVRQMVGTMLVGVSTHSMEQARQAVQDGADYIGAGPVFESATKEFSQFPGLPYLQEVAAEITIPTFAIGGITEDRLAEVLRTGVSRVAVSSVLLQAENPKEVAERFADALSRKESQT